MMFKLILFIFLLFSFQIKAASIEGGDWIVTDFVGEFVYVEPNEIVGQKQKFYDGIEGVFLNCQWGSVWTYNKYDTLEELLTNKEFRLMAEFKDHFNLQEEVYFVHRLSCGGTREGDTMMSLYPFITDANPNNNKAYYIFEMGIFELEIKE